MEENTNKIYSLMDQGKNSDIEGAIYRGLDFQMAKKALETSKDKIQMKKVILPPTTNITNSAKCIKTTRQNDTNI